MSKYDYSKYVGVRTEKPGLMEKLFEGFCAVIAWTAIIAFWGAVIGLVVAVAPAWAIVLIICLVWIGFDGGFK